MSGDDSWAADDDGTDAEEDGDRFRGWIHPDDRLWRHPSEGPRTDPRAAAGLPLPHLVSVGGATGAAAGRLGRRGVAPWLICGSLCVALAVAAVAVVVADTSDGGTGALTALVPMGRSAPTTEPDVPGGERLARLESALAGVRPSTVALRVAGPDGVSTVIGVVAEA
ncbi:MAG TPA: hypothetical protein VKW77_11405, partial [Acidimicrobiales bacterium]|nr:hypothetical protein [Acidimicrobiales bacterium]